MCDTRTWVFKLFIVFIIIHFTRIQQCRGVAASTGMDAIASGIGIDAAAIPIDDDSFEATSSPENTLSGYQRTNFNSTYTNNQQSNDDTDVQSSLSSGRSNAASDEGPDVDGDVGVGVDNDDDDEDDGGSNEGFVGNQRKFNNDEVEAPQRKQPDESSKRSSILNILQGVDYTRDATPASTLESTTVAWFDKNNNNNDEDDEDVDEILQPMVIASDKHHYHSNNGGRVMSPGVGYPIEYNPSRNEESSGSNNLKETPVTNRIKSDRYSSAFEQHKAHIRNSRRYGHKSHKKKYKDYLRYNPTTSATSPPPPQKATTSSPQNDIIARDRIINSEDIPRQFYQGHVSYFANTDDNYQDTMKKDQNPSENFRSYHNQRQHHNSHHLRNGGRYKHIGATSKPVRPHSMLYPEYNVMNYHHLGSRAMQQHQKQLEKKMDAYSQYYAKWPHLAQVEDQLFEDQHTDMLYPDGGGSSPGELVLSADNDEGAADKEDDDPNLPPYIKKYRRRNKQLMDLLEGTQPPSTSSPQWSSSVLKPGPIDGNHQNHHHQHRKHHNHRQHRDHQRSHRHKNSKWQIEDLFEEQRANPNNPNKTTVYSEVIQPTLSAIISRNSTVMTTTSTSTTTLSPFDELLKHENDQIKLLQENKLPAEDISISRELYDWAIDTSKDEPQLESNEDDEEYADANRFNKWKPTNRNAGPVKAITTTTRRPVASVRRPNVYGSIIRSPPTSTTKPINSFVYHRVVESPRAVGAGQTGRKQRLPFVAITDRRLETSRKGMGNAGVLARKDFEQNHFPMP